MAETKATGARKKTSQNRGQTQRSNHSFDSWSKGSSKVKKAERSPQNTQKKAPQKKQAPEPEKNTIKKKIKYKMFSLGEGLDIQLTVLIFMLLAAGLVMLFSASHASSMEYQGGDSYHFIRRQAQFAAVGVVVMFLISFFDYHQYHKLAWLFVAITLVMLLMTIIFRGTPIAPLKGGDASRWLNLGFVELQPSEIAKFSLILMYAHMISVNFDKMHTFTKGFLPFFGLLAVFGVLIVLERHVSATIIIAMIAVIIMLIGGTKLRYILGLGGIGVAGLVSLVMFSDKFAYAMRRVQGWIDPFNPPAGVDTHQTKQSLYAIGSGRLLGVGLGQSRQKYMYLPEPQNDFIFAIVCEELGFIGALIIIILFTLLIWRCIYVSLHAKDKFGIMLGLGIAFQLGLQIVLNICVVTNVIPNTGIGLPFFSYGGTALMILLAEMGVLLQISRSSNIEKM